MKSAFIGRLLSLIWILLTTPPTFAATCVSLPADIAGWWRGDSSQDTISLGDGTFRGTAATGAGYVGAGFALDGRSDGLQLPAGFRLTSQNFAIEGWIKRASDSVSSRDVEAGEFFANSNNGLAFGITHDGRLYLSHIGVVSFYGATSIRDTNWNHVAVTREGSALHFYTNGVLATSTTCSVVFNLDGPYALGGLGAAFGGAYYGFLGNIDELSAYNRALTASEIAAIHQAAMAGKCPTGPVNLIVNGSFEQPAYTSADGILPNAAFVRTRNLPGWDVAPGEGAVDVELQNFGGATAASGIQCLDLEGVEGLPTYFIRQDVAVTPGKTYRLRFAYAKNPAQSLSKLRVELTGAGVTSRDFEQTVANSRANPGWQTASMEFEATAGTIQVQFTGVSPNTGYGMLLDDVSLREVQFIALGVANPSFELLTGTDPAHFGTDGKLLDGHYSIYPAQAKDEHGFYRDEAIPSWVGAGAAGTFNVGAALLAAGAPDGQNTAWINGQGVIRQTLTQTFEANRLYRLSVDVAALTGVAFPGYAIALYGNGSLALQDTNSKAIPAGGYATASIGLTLRADSPLIGAPIEIRLGTIFGSGQGNFDNVRLEVESATDAIGCASPPAGLAAWFRAEDNAIDAKGQHPTTFTNARYAPGKVGQAFEFDGSNEVVIPDAPGLNFAAFSAEAWVYPTSLDGDVEIIMNKEFNGFDTIAFEFGVKGPTSLAANNIPTGNLALYIGGVSGMPSDYSGWADSGAPVPLNTWSHVVITYGDGTGNVFLNGTLARSFTGLTGTLRTTTGPLKIGSRSDSVIQAFPNGRFNGRIDEASLYSRALGAGEVAGLFQAGSAGKCVGITCTPPAANLAAWLRAEADAGDWTAAHPGTFANARYAAGKVGQAFEFNGTNEVALANAPGFNGDAFTLEAWVYPTALDGAVDMIVNKEAGTDFSQFQFEIGLKGPVNDVASQIPLGNVAFYLGGVTGLPDEYGGWVDGKASAPLNQWTHVALAVEPGSAAVFVNGVETRRVTGLDGTLQKTTGPLKLGSRHEGFTGPRPTERFNGRIDEFAFYTRRLADSEISVIHAAGEQGKCFRDAPPGDLELVLEAPAKVALNGDFILTARVINHGISPATGVVLTNQVPNGVSVTGVTNSQGTSVNLAGFVIANLGTVAGNQAATVQIVCRPLLNGTYQVPGRITRGETDPNPANDQQTATFEAVALEVSLGADVGINEGTVRMAEIPVLLSAATAGEVTVEFATVEGTAKAGRDFTASSGKLTFAPGSTQAVIQVPIINDGYFEANESFSVVLTNAVGAPLIRSNAVVTIQSDDDKPTLSVNDPIVQEGNAGGTVAAFTVRLIGASEEPVTVDYSTINGSALNPTDYLETVGTLTFAPGDTAERVEVRVNGDTVVEPNESFLLNLTNPTNAVLAHTRGAAVIVNDDFVPGQVAGFTWDPVSSPQEPGKPLAVAISAKDAGGNLATGFNGVVQLVALPSAKRPSSVVISEVDLNLDAVEFTNVGTNVVNLTGWSIVLYDVTEWPLPRLTVPLPENVSLPPRGVFRLSESGGSSVFPNLRTGSPLAWGLDDTTTEQRPAPTAVVLRDATGRVVDFFGAAGGFPEAIRVPVAIPESLWHGVPLLEFQNFSQTYQRTGSADSDGPGDWILRSSSLGRTNVGLVLPFSDATGLPVTPGIALDFVNGRWSGSVQIDSYAPLVSLLADDGNGSVGFSNPFALTATNDLAVTLAGNPTATTHPANVSYLATVTNPGPDISSNVVVEIRLAPYFGPSPAAIGFVQLSQGTSAASSYTTNAGVGLTSASRLIATLGEIAPGGSATVQFEASRSPAGAQPSFPSNVVAVATATRTQPDVNPANNSAQAVVEVAQPCVTLLEDAVAWWRADDGATEPLGTNDLQTAITAEMIGAGRVGEASFAFLVAGAGLRSSAGPALDFGAGQDFTVEAWVRVTGGISRERVAILGNRETADGVGYSLFMDRGRLGISLTDSAGASFEGFTDLPVFGSSDLRDGRWHHVAAVARRGDDSGLTLVLDGVAKGLSQGFAVTGSLATASGIRLGADAPDSPSGGLIGQLDEVTVYRTALTIAQIQGIFRAGAGGKCAAELSVSVVSPATTPSGFVEPIAFGHPVTISLLLTNAGPLALPTSWLYTTLVNEHGTTRLLTPAIATNVASPWMTYHDFGPLAPGGSLTVQTEAVLTNLPPNLRTDFTAMPKPLGVNYRFRAVALAWPVNPDGDADGAADLWELSNGFDPGIAADALADADADGASNVDEFHAGTDPRSAAEVLKLQIISQSGSEIRLRFPGKAGKQYGLERRGTLTSGEWSSLGTAQPATGDVEMFDGVPLPDGAFYRVRVLP